ncbi:MAG TPA: DUF167 domain-containing protein [Pyrinomonadaceae bacterium]|nr:DUF167 domain-containing protein [Pyrinomonadaceae bacterium]
MIAFIENDVSITFSVRVIPRSPKAEIVGEYDGALKIKLKSPPVDGAANNELIRFLSKLLEVPKANIEIVAGETTRSKRIRVSGITSARTSAILQAKI